MKRSVLIFFICITSFLQAQDLPEPMRPKRIVNDFTQLFSPQQQQALEQKLRNFNDTSSTQIAIVTVPTLQGYAPSDYAQRLAEKWGVGQKGKDNGVLLLIKPKSRTEIPQVAMEVEESLPYFSEVSAVAAAISVLSAEVAEASEVSAEGVSAVAGPVEAGKTINTDNANTGQYHMFTPQSRRGERHGIFVYQILQAFGTMGGFFPEQHSPVRRSGTGLFYPFMGKKDPNLTTSNHL